MNATIKCRCGCEGTASYLCTGKELDGTSFVDEPCCINAMLYLEDTAAAFEIEFAKRPVRQHSCGACHPTDKSLTCNRETGHGGDYAVMGWRGFQRNLWWS